MQKDFQKVLAVDFDHTIHDTANPVPGRRMGAPMDGAKEILEILRNSGWHLIVHSVWADGARVKTIVDWLRYYEIPYDEVTNEKPEADFYLDDKALKFVSWPQVLIDINGQ